MHSWKGGRPTQDANVINVDNNSSNANSNRNDDHDAYEKVCYVCRRPESKAGKMITISPDITICNDCMQKAFNQVNSGNFPKMFGIPEGFPFAGMPDDLMNMMSGMNMGMPEKQKIKKKKPDDQVKPIDLKAIPSPHQIHASLNEYVVGQEMPSLSSYTERRLYQCLSFQVLPAYAR